MSKISADFAQRQSALNTRASILVEAPAGSGKTGLLILRYLRLLADISVEQPEQVLAITFTRKATAEMKTRVSSALEKARTGPPPVGDETDHKVQLHHTALRVLERDELLGWHLLDNPSRFNIRTIDSVCTELARSMPVIAGAGALQQPVEDGSPLYAEAAARTLRLLGGDDAVLNDDIRTLLHHRDGNLADCERLLAEMLALREQWGHIVPLTGDLTDQRLDEETRPKLEAAIAKVICAELEKLFQLLGRDAAGTLGRLAAEMAMLEPHASASINPYRPCASLQAHPELTEAALEAWQAMLTLLVTGSGSFRAVGGITTRFLKVLFEKHHKERLIALIEYLQNDELAAQIKNVLSLPSPTYSVEQWQVMKSLFRLLRTAMVELQLLFAERGECDFSELSLAARAALDHDAEAATLAAGLGMRLQHLLVDEMQDTSTSQYDLLEKLTEGWDGVSQTVFLVGDPKQSIYLFRQARVERFLQTMTSARLGSIPLQVLRLSTNFRSQHHLVNAFNQVFTPVFAGDSITYTPAEPFLDPKDENAFRWNTSLSPDTAASAPGKQHAKEQTRLFARQIAAIAKTESGTKAVLVRDRKHLLEVIAAFREERIPYRAVEIDSLAERIEVLDLLALTRALLHPADRPAWFAILRAPWCGLPLADLHLLAGQDDPAFRHLPVPRLLETRTSLLPSNSAERAQRLWTTIRAALAERGTQPTSRWIERTWRSLGGDLGLTLEALANAAAYFQLIDNLEASGTPLASLPGRLRKLYATPEHHPEAVDLLTIHKSKGLEWDVVFVPALERKSATTSSRALNWLELESFANLHLISPISSRDAEKDALASWIRNIHKTREATERKRLFYVAATRAARSLHLYAVTHTTAKGEVFLQPDSLLRAAWPAAQGHFTPAPSNVIPFPAVSVQGTLSLAAEAEEAGLLRLPDGCNPLQNLASNGTIEPPQSTYRRPEAGTEARAFGNVVHLLVEAMAASIAAQVLPNVGDWHGRAVALLRNEGIPAEELHAEAARVVRALEKMLLDPEGRWLLQPHLAASNEFALEDETGRRLRTDRTFIAGSKPMEPGEDTLWIVDFKSSEHAGSDKNAFLSAQKRLYFAKMMQYAETKRAQSGSQLPLMLALYFPLLPALIYWPAE